MYNLLPFRFKRSGGEVLLVSDCGEYVFLAEETFRDLINDKLGADSQEYLELKSKWFVYDCEFNQIRDFLGIKYLTKRSFLLDFTALHMVVPTSSCNSECIYCQVSSTSDQSNSHKMNKATAQRTVDLILQSPSDSIKIEFQGGEPLLNFDTLRYIVEVSEKKALKASKHVDFVVCTNLILATLDILRFFKEHRVCVSTSLDGPRGFHDRNRPLHSHNNSSYDLFKEKFDLARSILGPNRISALLTVTGINLDHLEEVANEYIRLGFQSIFVRPFNPFGRMRTRSDISYSTDDFISKYLAVLGYIIELNKQGKFLLEEWAAILLRNVLTPFSSGFVDMRSPSGLGIGCAVYNHDGNVFASDEGRMLGESGDSKYLLGNVKADSFQTLFGGRFLKKIAFDSVLEDKSQCCYCAYLPYCGSDPVRNYVEGCSPNQPSQSSTCRRVKATLDFIFDKLQQRNTEDVRVLRSWIKNDSSTGEEIAI